MSSHTARCLSLEQLADEAVERCKALHNTKGAEHMHILLVPLQHFSERVNLCMDCKPLHWEYYWEHYWEHSSLPLLKLKWVFK